MQLTINYGIDLGTTNSAIALYRAGEPTLLPNIQGELILPSAVHISADRKIDVGNAARAFMDTDPENTKTEFKRLMGTGERLSFPASGEKYLPEELSALILRDLLSRTAAFQENEVQAAVITIPAMFHLPQNDATRRAANIAGIDYAILLQEPIAAAVAHANITRATHGTWLIYDLGGGTFDVSLVRSRKGKLQVLDHGGDNQLGGKDFDRLLVNDIAIRIRDQWKLQDFQRSNPTYRQAFQHLKTEAEKARIALSSSDQVTIVSKNIIKDEAIEITIDRDQLENILQSAILRSVQICKKVLQSNHVASHELNGIVLVGGPTLTPCLPHILERELGAAAEHVMNPINIVAYGAAVYASTQKMPEALRSHSTAPECINLQVAYEAMTTNTRPFIAARFDPSNHPAPAAFRIARVDQHFDTGIQPLPSPGTLLAELTLEPNTLNGFFIYLFDKDGRQLKTAPSEFTILHGLSVSQPLLSQSVGIMLSDNKVAWYIRKGKSLPADQTLTHHSTVSLKSGQSGEALNVPLVQGESERADRNKLIGVLRIHAEKIAHDLPVGSELQVTLSVDAYSQATARAYVPSLDQGFDDIIRFDMAVKKQEEMQVSFAQQHARLKELEALATTGDAAAEPGSMEAQEQLHQIEQLLQENDSDSMLIADKLIREMAVQLDQQEVTHQPAKLQEDFDSTTAAIETHLTQEMTEGEKREFAALKEEFRQAMERNDLTTASERVEQITDMNNDLFARTDAFLFYIFPMLAEACREAGKLEAEPFIAAGQEAINNNDLIRLRQSCRDLVALLPEAERKTGIYSNIR